MTPWLQDPDVTLYHGDNLDVLRQLPDRSVHMCATSPPFFGLRDYQTGTWEGGDPDCDHAPRPSGGPSQLEGASQRGRSDTKPCRCGARRVDQQIGLEETPDQWVERLVAVFREVRRVLRDDGTLWVEIGDSYGSSGDGGTGTTSAKQNTNRGSNHDGGRHVTHPTKPKDLLGQPWLLAFALRADGWYLRSEIIWARPNPMPESVTDRPTKSHSTVFLLSKQPRYFYDADAIREASIHPELIGQRRNVGKVAQRNGEVFGARGYEGRDDTYCNPAGANARSVWTIPTQPTPFAHFATWPEALVRRMILAGTSERGCCPECGAPWVRDVAVEQVVLTGSTGNAHNVQDHNWSDVQARTRREVTTTGWSPSCACFDFEERDGTRNPYQSVPCTVLDPFAGSGTTMLVARNHGRHSIGIELNEDYLQIAAKRLQQLSLLNT